MLSLDYLDRDFSILNKKYRFKFSKVPKRFINEFEVWLVHNKLLYATEVFAQLKIKRIEDFEKFKASDLDDVQLEDKQKEKIQTSIEKELHERKTNLIMRNKYAQVTKQLP